MEAVYILCNQGKRGGLPLHSRQRKMRRVGDLRGDDLPAPVIPLPHELRIPYECLRRGKLLCPEIPPQAVLSPEGRNSAVSRDAGAGQHTNRGCLGQFGSDSAEFFHLKQISASPLRAVSQSPVPASDRPCRFPVSGSHQYNRYSPVWESRALRALSDTTASISPLPSPCWRYGAPQGVPPSLHQE